MDNTNLLMAGWSHEKRVTVERMFRKFLRSCFINSKEGGFMCLGKDLYPSQERFIIHVFDCLERDIHNIAVLKSRQLGITTIARAATAFFLGMYRGLSGAFVFDSAENKNTARDELMTMLSDLPANISFPGIKKDNREGLILHNNAKLLFKHAGVKKSASTGTLGRSVGLAFAHVSEICSFDSSAQESLVSFQKSLAQTNPDRLYIWESTARGFVGLWPEMWREAEADPDHWGTLFIGWWSHTGQKIDRDSPDWERYGADPPTKDEQEKIDAVLDLYAHQVTQEQLAWYRRQVNPTGDPGDVDPLKIQEDPWTADEAWQQTGTVFFAAKALTEMTKEHTSRKFDGYMFLCSDQFATTKVMPAPNLKSSELRIWEEPTRDATYVIGVDPAYGSSEKNDHSSIQVLRCYADGVDQVAEYDSPLIATHQLAWVIAALLGWYGEPPGTDPRYILELNGPGTAVYNELKTLKRQVESTYRSQAIHDRSLQNIFRNVRTYIYSRSDAMGVGHNYHFKTTQQTKITYMERLRDFIHSGILHVRSINAVEDMKAIRREGDAIGAPANMCDDRVVSLALACEYWDTRVRPMMLSQNRTREAEIAKQRASVVDQVSLFQRNMLTQFFSDKRQQRIMALQAEARQAWRTGRR